ncbi:MAG TPA: sigma-70 family RNA polymerase sigma factor [Rhizomicrobium sp.]|jgi:RNA polymerase sigma-70 factor (ECF subfamily)
MRHQIVQSRMKESETPGPAKLNALVQAVANGRDRCAFEALFVHFAPRIKAYLLKLGANAALADDLAQEALLTLWRKAALFDPAKASAATWLFTIARNLRIDAIRRERRPDFDPEDPAFVPDAEPAADAVLMLEDDEVKLRVAMKDLSPEQAQVVQMSFFADKPHSQIAQELGLPLGTVKSRLRLAMARIRVTMAPQDGDTL